MQLNGYSFIEDTSVKIHALRISPQLAEQMKANMIEHQRKPSEGRIAELVKEMHTERFKVSNDAFVLCGDKWLNGQHRMEAIIRSGTTQTLLVLETDDMNLIRVIDGGKPRNLADVLTMDGMIHTRNMASTGMLVLAYDRKLLTSGGSDMSRTSSVGMSEKRLCSRQDKIEFITRHSRKLSDVTSHCAHLYKKHGQLLSPSTAAAAWFIIDRKDGPEAACSFIEPIYNGDEMSGSQKVLRTLLVRDAVSRRQRMTNIIRFGVVLKAYVSHRNGTTPAKLSLKNNEDFPVV